MEMLVARNPCTLLYVCKIFNEDLGIEVNH
jgi:hypothetical protein